MNKQLPGSDRAEADDLLEQLRRADRTEVGRFVRHHGAWMLAVSLRILKDEGHAEDAVQNAFACIFRKLETFEGGSSLKTWMHRIQINEALMLLRKQKRRKEEPIDDLLPEFDAGDCRAMDEWTSEQSPEALMQVAQFQETVAELIDQLPDNYRIVLLLRDIEELSTAEVAQMLELSEANVKVRLHRARSALKKLLEPLIRGQSL